MIKSLKQFVPSDVCLKCDGCCRTKEADSVWRPKLGERDIQNLALLLTASDVTKDGWLKTSVSHCGHTCRFLHVPDNTCRVYAHRPFECALYPFVLSQTKDAIKVYVHLSCPFVQDHQPSGVFDDYIDYLKCFFQREDVRGFLFSNKSMLHDYSSYAVELLYLFDV